MREFQASSVAATAAGASSVFLAAALRATFFFFSGAEPTSVIEMWLVRLRIGPAEPFARGLKRRRVGPAPMTASLMTKVVASSEKLFSASAMAVLSVLPISWAAFLGVKVKISRATSRAFWGERRTNFVVLLTSMGRRT